MAAGPELQINSASMKLACESMLWKIGGLPEIYFTFNVADLPPPMIYCFGDVKLSFHKYVVTSPAHHPPYITYRMEGYNERYHIKLQPMNVFVYHPHYGTQATRAAAAAAIQRLAERNNPADNPNENSDATNFQ